MMERTSGQRQTLRCWRLVLNLVLTLSLVVVIGASTFGKPFDHEDENGEVKRAYQPNGSVRSKRSPSTQISPKPLAVSAGRPLYSFTSASVRCVLLNASAMEASRGEWCWTILYPAANALSHVLSSRAATNVVIAFSLPGSLRGSTAVSRDGLESTITVFSVQQLRGYVNVSCLWKLSDGAHSIAQPRAKSAVIYGPPHIAGCQLASVSYTSASIDWLPLKADGKIAPPIDRYTLEVVHGTKTIQRIEKTGTTTHHVLPDVLQPHTLYTATLFGSNSAGNGTPCHVTFRTNEVAALAIQSCPVLDSNGHFYLIAAWKPQFPESLVSYQCELRKQGVKSKVWSESTRSQCAAGQARVVPAANSTAAALGSYQMEVIESLSQNTTQVLQYTTTLTVEIDYVSASVEYIGDGTYLVTCELACHSQLTGCAVYLNSSRTGAVGTDWDELSTIPVNAQRDMALLGISRPMAVWNVTLYGSCVESMGVQAVQSGKVMGQVKSIMVVYHTATAEADCVESSHSSSQPNGEMEIIITVLALVLVLICILCCVALIALLKWNCSYCIKKRSHLHLGHSVFPTYAHPIFLRYHPTPPDQPRAEEQQQGQQQQQQGPNGDHPQDNAAPVFVRHIDLEHVDHSYDCDTV